MFTLNINYSSQLQFAFVMTRTQVSFLQWSCIFIDQNKWVRSRVFASLNCKFESVTSVIFYIAVAHSSCNLIINSMVSPVSLWWWDPWDDEIIVAGALERRRFRPAPAQWASFGPQPGQTCVIKITIFTQLTQNQSTSIVLSDNARLSPIILVLFRLTDEKKTQEVIQAVQANGIQVPVNWVNRRSVSEAIRQNLSNDSLCAAECEQ